MVSYKKQIIFLSISVLVCIVFFFSIYSEVKKKTIEELNNRQMVYARLAAHGIEDSFNHYLQILDSLAHDEHIISMDNHGLAMMESYPKIAANEIRGITRLDPRGRITYSFPYFKGAIGADISGQDHVRNILQNKKPVISDVFLTIQGYQTVAIHVPVYKGKAFDGTLGLLISFEALAKRYLDDIKIEKSGYAWMISASGIEIYCPVPGHVGNSVFTNCKDFPEIIAMAQHIMQGKKGITTYTFASSEEDVLAKVKKHAVYMPVKIGNTFWSIVVATPEDTVLAPMKNFRNQLMIIMLILLLVFATIAYAIARMWSTAVEQQKSRQIEDNLIKSAREVHDLYHNAPCGYHSLDTNGMILRINDTELSWLGYTREELAGQSYTRVLSEAGRDHFSIVLTRLKEKDEVHETEYEMMRKDGSTFPVLVTASAVTDPQGNFVMSRSMVMDITRRKQIEVRLRESEALYRTALQSTNDGIAIIQDGKYVYTNQKLLNTLGRPDENLLGQSLGAFIHPDDQAMIKKRYRDRLEGKPVPSNYDFRALSPDNTTIMINLSAVEIVYQGRPAVLSFIQNITQRRQVEDALRQSEERYRTIIESIDDDYFEADLDGNITFLNKQQALSGHNREEFIGMNYRQYTTPEMAKKIFLAFSNIYHDGMPARIVDYEIFRKDGSTAHQEMSVSLIRDSEGRPAGFRGISRDVTERLKLEEEHKRLTEQLHQAQKMEAIGTLAGGIAHDFNNLLMGIQGYTSLMLLEVDATHPYYEQLKAVQTLVQSGASLTRQLLGFARAGRYDVIPTNLNDLIRKSINLFGRTRKEIRIFEKYAEKIWTVETDRGQIEQVLLNMFVNAWQAMPGGGSLYLETENVVLDDAAAKIHDLKPGRYVKTSITDTGVGMDEKTRQRIFDPFFTTKAMGRGTGMGLASAYGIIKGHEGLIAVYSEIGQGTTFSIYLPASSKEVNSEKPAEQELAGGRETILLVDDEEVITDVTGRLLKELGYQIITAPSGADAIDIYIQQHAGIDLVIIDMIMPGLSGSDTFDRIKTINPSVRAILSSGYSLDGKAQAIMNRGVRVFLQKPYRLNDLAQKIREALSD